jgi:hypothetical protein
MIPKEQLIAELRGLISSLEEGNIDAADERLKWPLVLYYNHWAIEVIEQKLDALIERSSVRCRLFDAEGVQIAHLMTGLGPLESNKAVTHLRDCMAGATSITICDPYLLTLKKQASASDYVHSIEGVLPASLTRLELFVGKMRRNPEVAKHLNELCKTRGIRLSCYKTDDIHDRVWIADNNFAYSVGTSFNGFGNKCSFILPLSHEDRRSFAEEINNRRDKLSKSKSA